MADITDVLLHTIDKQWSQAKQSEDQRATMTNYIIVLAIGLEGFIVQRQFDRGSPPLAVVIIFLGIYGAIASAKYYERFRLSVDRVRVIRGELDKLHSGAMLQSLEEKADELHEKHHPRLVKLRLHTLWLMLHLLICIGGIIDLIVILNK
jgi:hypothetical protein